MPALITLSHGSRHPGAAAGIERLTQATGLRPARAAHLEFNEPNLTTAALELAQLGETEAIVVPLLFTQGYHHRVDVPRALADAAQTSHLSLHLAPGLGTGEDLARAYATFDVFVHTGTKETFGQTLQEAAAAGLPVVAPAVGGPLDLVDHGRSGYLFAPDVRGDLARWVAELVDSPALRESMGDHGPAMVADRSWSSLTEQLVGHYEAAASAHAA